MAYTIAMMVTSLAKLHMEPKLGVGDLCYTTVHGLLGSETVHNAVHGMLREAIS